MNCYKCATPLPDNSRFCMACGADVSGEGHTHEHTGITPPDPELQAMLQAELGNEYVVDRELGRGGMAIVYLGHDKHLGRKVAIKLLPPMLTFGSGPGFIERFKREARTAATLDHQHIIPVYRVSTGGKLFWYVMKFLQGESLDITLKRDGQMEVGRAIEILVQVADALDYAHQNNVVHRDIKPANIMLDTRGRVTVTDFGIAKAMVGTQLTNSGATIGTPHYMSPEQCLGTGVSGASDQYALAVSAYQMFSGHLPFAADSVLELMRMHTQDPPPPLGTLRPTLPSALVAAVERGLAKEPGERFPSCMDFARALERAARDMDDGAKRPTAPTPATVVENLRTRTPKPVLSTAATPPVPSPTSRRAALIGGVAVLAIIAAVSIPKFLGNTPPASPTAMVQQQNNQPQPRREPDTANRAPAVGAAIESTKVVSAPAQETKQTSPRTTPETKQKNPVSTPVTDRKAAAKQPDPTPPPVAAMGKITVGSTTPAAILINGRAMPTNPVVGFDVPAGSVRIRFQVTDSTGAWSVDTTVTVAAGENKRLGRLALKRP